jgi:hypothetical protein
MSSFLAKIFGANYKTSLSAIGTAIFAAITFLAQVSYDQGPIATVIPVKYKSTVTLIAGACTLFLWFWNGIAQKSKEVTGGAVQQTHDGQLAQRGTQTLVDLTRQSPPAS